MFNWETHLTALFVFFALLLVFCGVLIQRIFYHFKKERELLELSAKFETRNISLLSELQRCREANDKLVDLNDTLYHGIQAGSRTLDLRTRVINLKTKKKKGHKKHGRRNRKG
jgi:hypothetical protein